MDYLHEINGELHLDDNSHNILKLIIKEKRFIDTETIFTLYAETDLNKNRSLTYSVLAKNYHDVDGNEIESSRYNTYNYMGALNDFMQKVCTESDYLHEQTMAQYEVESK